MSEILDRKDSRLLIDEGLQHKLQEDGYVMLDFINQQLVSELIQYLNPIYDSLEFRKGIHITNEHSAQEQRHQVSADLMDMIFPVLGDVFNDVKLIHGNFFIKQPSSKENEIGFHRDWSFVDESNGERSYTLWIPLCDITEHMGGIGVLQASHRKVHHLKHPVPRETYRFNTEIQRIVDDGEIEWLTPKSGQAILWDHRTVHCSGVNTSEKPRSCVTFTLTSAHNHLGLLWEENEVFKWYEVPDDFYHLNNRDDLLVAYRNGQLPLGAELKYLKATDIWPPLMKNVAHADS